MSIPETYTRTQEHTSMDVPDQGQSGDAETMQEFSDQTGTLHELCTNSARTLHEFPSNAETMQKYGQAGSKPDQNRIKTELKPDQDCANTTQELCRNFAGTLQEFLDQGQSDNSSQEYEHTGTLTWPLRDLDEQTWITGTHSELQQRILFLLPLAQRCEQAEQEQEQVQKLHTESYIQYARLIDWMKKLFANKTIPLACKAVMWCLYMHFFFSRSQQMIDNEMHITVKEIASGLGCDEKTVRKACDKIDTWNVASRRYEDVITDQGDKHKNAMVYFTLNEDITTPDFIRMEKQHGGKRIKRCAHCGSEDVDRYTVQYCRCCNKNDWYFQPGTRNDAPWEKAQKAENRAVYGTSKNQDAFASSARSGKNQDVFDATSLDAELESLKTSIVMKQDPNPRVLSETGITNNNQDAFGDSESQAPVVIDQRTQETHHVHSSVAEGQRYDTSAKRKHDADTYVVQQPDLEEQKQDAFGQLSTPSLSLSPENSLLSSLTEEESTFWTQWCSVSKVNYENLNETAYHHVRWLAGKALTTTEVQSLYDYAYDRLREFSQNTGKAVIPPRLGNLVKVYPEWAQTRVLKDRDQDQTQKQLEHIPGSGRVRNWTQERMEGKLPAQPIVYRPLPSRAKGTPQKNNLDFSGMLEQLRTRKRGTQD